MSDSRIEDRGVLAVLLAVCLATTQVAVAANPGGSGSDEGEGRVTAYIAVGLVLLIGGLFTLDILSDSGETAQDSTMEAVGDPEVSTIVDWEQVDALADRREVPEAGIAVLRFDLAGEDGYEAANLLLDILRSEHGGLFASYYPEPLDLRGYGPSESHEVANGFYGIDRVLGGFSIGDGAAVLYMTGAGGAIAWSDTLSSLLPDSLRASLSRLSDWMSL